MKVRLSLLFLSLWYVIGMPLQAQEVVRPVTMSVSLGAGHGSVRNTYLSPLLYSGSSLGIEMQRWRMQRNLHWSNWQQADLTLSLGTDRGVHSDQMAGRLRYRYGVLHTWRTSSPWVCSIGPYAGVDAGFDYSLKTGGGNNPATARATANVGATGMVSYRFVRPALQGMKFRLQVSAPLLGMALQPDYGASYYEAFYLQNTDHILHLTSLHNQQDASLQLSFDVPLAIVPICRRLDSVVRLGAGYNVETMRINHVVTRHDRFEFVIGWVYQYLPYGPRKSHFANHHTLYEAF